MKYVHFSFYRIFTKLSKSLRVILIYREHLLPSNTALKRVPGALFKITFSIYITLCTDFILFTNYTQRKFKWATKNKNFKYGFFSEIVFFSKLYFMYSIHLIYNVKLYTSKLIHECINNLSTLIKTLRVFCFELFNRLSLLSFDEYV